MYHFFRDEMISERLQTAELQAKLIVSVQEKLKAQGERERLELEMQHLNEQLKRHLEQHSASKETPTSSQKPELQQTQPRFSPAERTQNETSDQVGELRDNVLL